ncbi:MAG: hypothetical protein AB8I08_27270 [Sandaracinaceae bacterium]
MSARCGTHIGLTAVGTCARCGDYVCSTCLDTSYPEQCVRCAARLPHGVAWEDARAGSWPRRFTLTVSQMLTRPRVAFPGPVRLGSPLVFAYACGLIVMGLFTLLAFVQQPTLASAFPLGIRVASSLVMVSTLGLLVLVGTLVLAASFAAGLFVAGRRVGLLRYSLRAMAYAQGVMLGCSLVDLALGGLLSMAGVGTAAGTVVTLGAELLWVAGTLRLAHAAARGLGLSSVRASLAALAPTTWIAYIAVVRFVTGLESFL